MMKRNLFFWLEKLKITRAERYAVLCLMAVLVVLVLVNAVIRPSSAFDLSYYKNIEQEFHQRTTQLQQKEQKLLARYKKSPALATSAADTLPGKKISSPKHT